VTITVSPTASPTRMTTDSLQTALAHDFRAACQEYTEACELRATKDSRSHRDAVAHSLSRIDALLDMYLDGRPR
jgi:hypothetical protein